MSINMGPAGRVDLSRRITIDTSDILFVFGGAFPGIVDIVRNRLAEEGANSCEMGETEIYEKVKDAEVVIFLGHGTSKMLYGSRFDNVVFEEANQ